MSDSRVTISKRALINWLNLVMVASNWMCLFIISICLLIGPIVLDSQNSPMIEICDNALDDDADGLIDLNDSDCTCIIIEPESLIPNPSFEDMKCCPSNRSQLDCADVWIQASEPTTDYIHTCGWFGWDDFPVPEPFPDGEGVMGFRDGRRIGGFEAQDSESLPEYNWKEYAGACLTGPLKADESYRFEFHVGFVDFEKSPAIDISFFGTTDCVNMPFGIGDQELGCPTNGANWVFLGSRLVSGSTNSWVKTSIDVIPSDDIQAIAIGPPCRQSSSTVSSYYFFDELILADTRSFEFVIAEEGHPCEVDFTLSIIEEPNQEYQWYKEGIALLTETTSTLSQMYGEGQYQVRILAGGSCSLTKIYDYIIPVLDNSVSEIICEGESFQFGNISLDQAGQYVEVFKNQFNCDSIVGLTLDVQQIPTDSVNAKIFKGEMYNIDHYSFSDEGFYEAALETSIGCDSFVYLTLGLYEVYLPSAFSPNGDGSNDVFEILGGDDLIQVNNLLIYDRWGSEVFAANEVEDNSWDGTHEGESVQPGPYVFRVTVVMDDGKERSLSGTVALVR